MPEYGEVRKFATGLTTAVRVNPESDGVFNGVWETRFDTIEKIWDGNGWHRLQTPEAVKVLRALSDEQTGQQTLVQDGHWTGSHSQGERIADNGV